MKFLVIIVWDLNCVYVWYFDFYDFAYYLISAFIFFVSCVDSIDVVEKILRKKDCKKMWAINGLGLIFGLLMSAGVMLTSFRINDSTDLFGMAYVSWLLGALIAFYFIFNFLLYSKRLICCGNKKIIKM